MAKENYNEHNGVNVISGSTTISGNIVTSEDCRIDGMMKGNIQSTAKVIIGENGTLEGEIVCKSIDIEGKVKANINVSELLSLKANALLVGNITAGKIAIEPGANFTGNCKMLNHAIPVNEPEPAN